MLIPLALVAACLLDADLNPPVGAFVQQMVEAVNHAYWSEHPRRDDR